MSFVVTLVVASIWLLPETTFFIIRSERSFELEIENFHSLAIIWTIAALAVGEVDRRQRAAVGIRLQSIELN